MDDKSGSQWYSLILLIFIRYRGMTMYRKQPEIRPKLTKMHFWKQLQKVAVVKYCNVRPPDGPRPSRRSYWVGFFGHIAHSQTKMLFHSIRSEF